jgi:hypothetical protein
MTRIHTLSADTLRARESRLLCAWALEHGGDEFTIEVMALQGVPAPLADAFEDSLEAWVATPRTRATLWAPRKEEFTREVRLWQLTPISATLLHEFLPDGLFSYDVQERGWFENPVVYRNGAFLYGALTHEREGYVRVSDEEAQELAALGITLGPTVTGLAFQPPLSP